MASADDVATLDRASLDAFRVSLVEAGFEPVRDARRWRGPIAEPLSSLTTATEMEIGFEDGWPYRPPKLYVDGVLSEHAVRDGELCLYQPDEQSLGWLTLDGFLARIAEWVAQQAGGFRPEDDVLDAHLYFRGKRHGLATIDLAGLEIEPGTEQKGKLHADWPHEERVLRIRRGRPPEGSGAIAGQWYYRPTPTDAPPRDLDGFRELLTRGQQNNLERRLRAVAANDAQIVLLLVWETMHANRNALALVVEPGEDGTPDAKSMELAPTDTETRKLRAGPDVDLLDDKRIAVFGVGAIGSNAACRLAEAGAGTLVLIDGDMLRPSNIVRHAVSSGVGYHKAVATAVLIDDRAPWTEVEPELSSTWKPERLAELMRGCDAVVEATGMATFAELLARIAWDAGVPLVSAALYRGGRVARVRRQLPPDDTPLSERVDEESYPLIPPGDEPVTFEIGCSAAVNNASPIAVAAVAATTADVVIDMLSASGRYREELIDIYRPLEAPPFDRVGRL